MMNRVMPGFQEGREETIRDDATRAQRRRLTEISGEGKSHRVSSLAAEG